jgi:hypothetical protein
MVRLAEYLDPCVEATRKEMIPSSVDLSALRSALSWGHPTSTCRRREENSTGVLIASESAQYIRTVPAYRNLLSSSQKQGDLSTRRPATVRAGSWAPVGLVNWSFATVAEIDGKPRSTAQFAGFKGRCFNHFPAIIFRREAFHPSSVQCRNGGPTY